MTTENENDPTLCNRVGYLTVGGRKVGLVKCDELAGHHESYTVESDDASATFTVYGTPHVATLTWTDETPIDWPEAYDPDEPIDVDVPEALPADYREPPAYPRLAHVPHCPECLAGKHHNCDGSTWDNERDERTLCPCFFGTPWLHPASPEPPLVEPEPQRVATFPGACKVENDAGERCAFVAHEGRHTWEL